MRRGRGIGCEITLGGNSVGRTTSGQERSVARVRKCMQDIPTLTTPSSQQGRQKEDMPGMTDKMQQLNALLLEGKACVASQSTSSSVVKGPRRQYEMSIRSRTHHRPSRMSETKLARSSTKEEQGARPGTLRSQRQTKDITTEEKT